MAAVLINIRAKTWLFEPLCSTQTKVNYVEMDNNGDPPSPKKPQKKIPVPPSGPSADRVKAQNIIVQTPGIKHPVQSPQIDRGKKQFVRKDPSSVKPPHRNKTPKKTYWSSDRHTHTCWPTSTWTSSTRTTKCSQRNI